MVEQAQWKLMSVKRSCTMVVDGATRPKFKHKF